MFCLKGYTIIVTKSMLEYIKSKARIIAVIGLHGNSFKPHTGLKLVCYLLGNIKIM